MRLVNPELITTARQLVDYLCERALFWHKSSGGHNWLRADGSHSCRRKSFRPCSNDRDVYHLLRETREPQVIKYALRMLRTRHGPLQSGQVKSVTGRNYLRSKFEDGFLFAINLSPSDCENICRHMAEYMGARIARHLNDSWSNF